METQESLRARKKIRTREALIETATRLFLEKGFDSTTADEIAEAAEVSRSTFFRYFPTKEALVFPNQQRRIDQLHSLLTRYQRERPPFEAVRRACTEMAGEFLRARAELLTQYRIVQASPYLVVRQLEWDVEWETAIADAIVPGGDASTPAVREAQVLAGAVFGVIRVILREWYTTRCGGDLVEIGDRALKILESGLGGESALDPTDQKPNNKRGKRR